MRARWWLFLGSVVLCGAALAWAAVSGPDPFPTHFTFRGDPDSWSSRGSALAGLGAVSAGLAVLFGALAACASRLPSSAINTPRRDYWLTHRDELDRILSDFMLTIGTLTMLLFATIFATVTVAPGGATMGIVPAIFLLAILADVVYLVWKLINPPGSSAAKAGSAGSS